MKEKRAAEIAKKLNDTARWHSHGYGISKEVFEKELNLMIDDFGANEEKCATIRAYYDLFADYMVKRGTVGAIHIHGEYRPFIGGE